MSILRRALIVGSTAAVAAVTAAAAIAGVPAAASTGTQPTAASHVTGCFGFYPRESANHYPLKYAPGCYGHDEPMLNPESSAANSATDITWTVVLPKDGTAAPFRKVIEMGPTFWFGATVKDTVSLNSQGELEVQFYPDGTLSGSGCTSNGGFSLTFTPNKYTSCMPVWAVNPSNFNEYAAFNAMLNLSTNASLPLVMNAGDTVTVRIYVSGGHYNVFVKDITTGQQSSVIPLVSGTDGPLTNSYTTNVRTNNINWGAVQNTPLSFAYEIGHPDIYTYPRAPQCVPGMFNCFSYNVTNGWAKTAPLQFKSIIYNNIGSHQPTAWSTVDGQGGSDQDVVYCGSYNAAASGGSCTMPWYSYNGTRSAIVFGGAVPGTTFAEGTYHQFKTSRACTGFYGPNTLYCATTMPNNPPIP